MTQYLLDTNIVSEMIRPQPQHAVMRWLGDQDDSDLHFSAVSVGEVKRGIVELPAGQKRRRLEQWYGSANGPRQWFGSRVVPFEERTAEIWADLIAEGRRKGRPRSVIDMMIAATALVNGLTLVSLNQRDFEGIVALVNPAKA